MYALILTFVLGGWTWFLHLAGQLRRAPLAIHNLAWTLSLAIVGSRILHYTPDSGYTWVLITGGIVTFNIAMLLPAALRSPAGGAVTKVGLEAVVSRSGFVYLLGGYTLGFALYLRKIASVFGISALISDPSNVRAKADLVIGTFPLYGKLLIYLGPLLLILILNQWAVIPVLARRWRVIILVLLMVSFLATLQRTNLFEALAWELAVLVLRPTPIRSMLVSGRECIRHAVPRPRQRRLVTLIALIVIGVASFQFLGNILQKNGSNDTELQANASPLIRGTQWASLFEYASAGIPAFSNLVESQNHASPPGGPGPKLGDYNPQTWGRATFQTFLKAVPVVPAWDPVGPFTREPFGGNVYTWFEPYFRDFRAPGVIVLTFLSGLMVAAANCRRFRNGAWMLIAAVLVGMTAFAPFANRYIEDYTIEYILILCFLSRFGVVRRRHQASGARGTQPTPAVVSNRRSRPLPVSVSPAQNEA